MALTRRDGTLRRVGWTSTRKGWRFGKHDVDQKEKLGDLGQMKQASAMGER